jgi:hypothetical protein
MGHPQLVVADAGAQWCLASSAAEGNAVSKRLAAHAAFQPEAELGGILAVDNSVKQCLVGVWADVTDDGSGV